MAQKWRYGRPHRGSKRHAFFRGTSIVIFEPRPRARIQGTWNATAYNLATGAHVETTVKAPSPRDALSKLLKRPAKK